ncbi:NAD(P)/FAD-dependent oxidoreductase [Marinobacter salicampi]|uniref:NAD(P)/FAD-dependent oxidoreductase n=1 Tax=Marinobacter salicampi TaxID=435907 RepID=UPI0014087B33|nr:NAD(P)/FAD-dependent oxidoreductase [Marinobacter salicampi]
MTAKEALQTDTVVIGAGVVGLAVAQRLASRGQDVIVLEAGGRFGEGLSSRNSEVIHGGLYYPQHSLKARLCNLGREELYRYCASHKVDHRKTGKWIIACDGSQLPQLSIIARTALANDVELEWADSQRLNQALPEVKAQAGLFSRNTGIVDSHGLMLSLLGKLESRGGQLVCRAPVEAVASADGRHCLSVGGDMPCQLTARRVVNAAGLNAVPLARLWQGYPQTECPDLYFARGSYFSYSGPHPFSTLVYPVPEPGGLGIHLTLDLAGQARFGPDVEWIDSPSFDVDPDRRHSFARSIRRWWPGVNPNALQPAYAGVRPKLGGPATGFCDFVMQDESVHGIPGLVQLFGIESPGLTASLAIADWVVERLGA